MMSKSELYVDIGRLEKIKQDLAGSIPSTWLVTTLGTPLKWSSGGTPRSGNSEYYGGDIPWIVIGDLNDSIVISSAEKITDAGLKNSSAKIVESGSILLGMYGSIGKLGIAGMPLATNQAIAFAYPVGLDGKYVFYFLLFSRGKLLSLGKGATQKNISQTVIKAFPFVLAPLAEQQRIVAKLEELFSELDKGVESLRTAQQQLKVYRQALLKHAFEGKLTAKWRAQNPDKLESAEALLERIHQEREVRHQQKLAEWKDAQQAWEAAGKIGRKPAKPREPKALPPLTAEELAELQDLPVGWNWVRIGEAFGVYVGSTPSRSTPSYWGGKIPWVSSGEVAFCRIKSTKERITELGYLNASTEIHPSGTVVLAMIGEGKTRGQAAILDVAAAHNQNTAAIRVSESGCLPEFLYFYLCFQYEMTRKLGSGNNQKALNKERVSEMRIPFLSLAEQQTLVQLVDEKFSVIDQLELTITTSLQQAESLRQSILKKAFAGQLVAQCPDDEPASVLLERIRSERTAQQPARKRGRKVATSA